jgi:hypothetical protein
MIADRNQLPGKFIAWALDFPEDAIFIQLTMQFVLSRHKHLQMALAFER